MGWGQPCFSDSMRQDRMKGAQLGRLKMLIWLQGALVALGETTMGVQGAEGVLGGLAPTQQAPSRYATRGIPAFIPACRGDLVC